MGEEELNPGLHLIRITSSRKLRRNQVRKLMGVGNVWTKKMKKSNGKKKMVNQRRTEEVIFFIDIQENETIVQLVRPLKASDRIQFLKNEVKIIDEEGNLNETEDMVLNRLKKSAEIKISAIDNVCEAAKIFDRTEKRREDIRERIILVKDIEVKDNGIFN